MERGKLIQLIHIAKNKLGIDTDTYRQMLLSITGITSTSGMNPGQLNKVLAAMKAKGFKVKPSRKARTTRPLADHPQARKLRALWLEMYAQGIVRDSSEEALRRWVKRETKVDGLQWLEPEMASSAIEKLKNWQKDRLKKAARST
ncbi:gp16 family protein [Citrobacter braakii]|uniref:GemA protein n=1 Tax=Citrobacter braakii TaxID=57706 RepID=A0A1V8NVU7_CITBR|nr:regulatory protein GemA [Citrobacter braakii]EBW7149639.1 regulatory protein GemA [Salmonella enterica subsp. enterica serovar Coeln]OQM40534.1 GemA protein [Citrobacter braakii]QXC18172.1 regulatory protein GemA [Citrobacter braakii]